MSFSRELTFAFLAFCLFKTAFSGSRNDTITFTSSQEVFVGEDALLEWKVNANFIHNIAKIKFGIVTRQYLHGERLDAILVKKFPQRNGKIYWNKHAPKHIAAFLNRTKVLANRVASFKIRKVSLKDSSEFYCTVISIGSTQTMFTDYVKVKVIDVQILNKTSSQDVISWRGHKVQLHCNVRVVPNTKTSFVWRNKATGGTVVDPSKQHDNVTSSFLIIRTFTDEEFGPYECIVMTTATNYSHEIRLKRLFEPSAPNNFSHDRRLTINKNCSVVVQLTWMPPLEDGGALVTSYIVEYKPFGQMWDDAKFHHVTSSYVDICRPERDHGGDGLRVRVKAKNKVGVGEASPSTIVTFWDEPTAPQALRTRLVRSLGDPFIKLTWGYPRDDGGVPVSAYQIEHKPVGLTWNDAARSETLEQETTLWKTSKNVHLYEVRIRGINGVGFGEWSSKIKAAFAEVPTRPLDVRDKALPHARPTQPHIHVHWNRPIDNGGLPITQYRLEYKLVSKKNWKRAKQVFPKDEEYVIQYVDNRHEYHVRVAAQNQMGTGAWSNVVAVKYKEKSFIAFKARSFGTRHIISTWQVILFATVGLVFKSLFQTL